jgi:hypothetical protein
MSDMRRLLEAMDSMSRAETKPTGPKFPGYWKGTDSASAAKNKMVGGCDQESVIPELAKTAKKKSTEWELEEAYKQFKEGEYSRNVIPQPQSQPNYTLDKGYGTPLPKIADPAGDQSGGFKKVLPGEKFDSNQWSLPGKLSGTPDLPVSPNVNTPLYTGDSNPPEAGDPGLGVKYPTDTFSRPNAQGIRAQPRFKSGKEPVELKDIDPIPPVTPSNTEKFDPAKNKGTNTVKVNPATDKQDAQTDVQSGSLQATELVPGDDFIKNSKGEWELNPKKYSPGQIKTLDPYKNNDPKIDISREEMDDINQQIQQQNLVKQHQNLVKSFNPAVEPNSNSNSTGSSTLRDKINQASDASVNSPVKTGTTSPAQATPEAKPGSWQEIAKLNNITDPTKLRAGQRIKLPSDDDSSYEVAPGDTLSSIAHSLRTTGQPPDQLKSQRTTPAVKLKTQPAPEIDRGHPIMPADRDRTPPANAAPASTSLNDTRRQADIAALKREISRQKPSNDPRENKRTEILKKELADRQVATNETLSQQLAKDFEQFLESDEPYKGYDQDVEKLKQRAKLGPMKTVWDEKTQRYRVVPVKPQEKQIKEYGNTQNADTQATNADTQQTSRAVDPSNPDAMAQKVDIATAKSTMSGLKNILGPQLNTNAAASGIVNMNDGKPLSVPEREAISTLTPLVTKAAENPATAGALKSALSTAGMLAKQGK